MDLNEYKQKVKKFVDEFVYSGWIGENQNRELVKNHIYTELEINSEIMKIEFKCIRCKKVINIISSNRKYKNVLCPYCGCDKYGQ